MVIMNHLQNSPHAGQDFTVSVIPVAEFSPVPDCKLHNFISMQNIEVKRWASWFNNSGPTQLWNCGQRSAHTEYKDTADFPVAQDSACYLVHLGLNLCYCDLCPLKERYECLLTGVQAPGSPETWERPSRELAEVCWRGMWSRPATCVTSCGEAVMMHKV
ncbi:hypothetical protein B0H17DRAFT_1136176 [Mycena rosella]|uniref:Uncharacterized protein n=1 Tax=Mycena rosella TaxID=1033263 RepID=A0AAD7DEK7_MYCRO|nr:hypothetical protein B0H17DRAFT_1136176 [Mycena rosella]